jgi:hypothetical protein
MHAATVDLMTKKAHFETETAMAVAEAFDIAIQHAQLVTVPMLDVRLAQFQSGIDERFGKVDARFLALEARVNSLEVKMEVLFALQEERLDKKLEALKADVVRWVFLVMLGNAAISAAVNALMNSFQHLR